MRRILIGVNERLDSCVLDVAEVETHAVPGVDYLSMASLFATESSPPTAGPPQSSAFVEKNLAPGMMRCSMFDHLPGDRIDADATSVTMHHGAGIDLIFVLGGSSRLILRADEIDVLPGDFVVLPGVDHAFVNGSEGCRMIGFQIGTERPASAPHPHEGTSAGRG